MTHIRRIALALFAFLALASASAADLATIEQTIKPLRGAVEGIGSGQSSMVHLPGYGVHMSTTSYISADGVDREELIDQISTVLTSLSGMVRGLDDGDVISVSYYAFSAMTDAEIILVRMQPGAPESLEVFIDSVPFE